MSTRGFIGIKTNGKISGKYNRSDSYYGQLGTMMVETYFDGRDTMKYGGDEPLQYQETDNLFLYDGLYCEYGYIYNGDNDTLEIYRGFFNRPQFSGKHFKAHDGKKYYTHLVTVIDKRKHTKSQALRMMKYYDKNSERKDYPERGIINICDFCFKNIALGEEYCSPECKKEGQKRKVVLRLTDGDIDGNE